MSLYIDMNVSLKVQMLSFSSLLGPGVSIELKQRDEDWHFLDNVYILRGNAYFMKTLFWIWGGSWKEVLIYG